MALADEFLNSHSLDSGLRHSKQIVFSTTPIFKLESMEPDFGENFGNIWQQQTLVQLHLFHLLSNKLSRSYQNAQFN